MSKLYEPCPICKQAGAVEVVILGRRAPGDCPACRGGKFIEVGLTTGQVDRLRTALERSVAIQSHYAGLLNQYDGGRRMLFADADQWIERLRQLEGEVAK